MLTQLSKAEAFHGNKRLMSILVGLRSFGGCQSKLSLESGPGARRLHC